MIIIVNQLDFIVTNCLTSIIYIFNILNILNILNIHLIVFRKNSKTVTQRSILVHLLIMSKNNKGNVRWLQKRKLYELMICYIILDIVSTNLICNGDFEWPVLHFSELNSAGTNIKFQLISINNSCWYTKETSFI